MTPRILAQTLRVMGKGASAEDVSSLVERFVNYSSLRGWHMHMPRVIQLLEEMPSDEDFQAEAVSARELSASEKAPLEKIFGRDAIKYTIDPSVVGGIKIRCGDEQWDMTTDRALKELQTLLAS